LNVALGVARFSRCEPESCGRDSVFIARKTGFKNVSKVSQNMTKKTNSNPIEPIKANCGKVGATHRTNPIFLRPIMDFYIKNAEMEARKLGKKRNEANLDKCLIN
jgi:hypothetical protein